MERAVVADDDPADRPRDKPKGIRTERRERPRQWIEGREVETIEDECGCSAVKIKVVPLDCSADEAGQRDELDRVAIHFESEACRVSREDGVEEHVRSTRAVLPRRPLLR